MTILLEVRGLSVAYGDLSAVEDVDLVVPEGSVVALLGPNGAGKTTTLRAISGTTQTQRGEILLEGRRIDGLAAHRIARLGVCHIPEGRGIFPGLTVEENLLMQGATDEATTRVTKVFPFLAKRGGRRAGTLSGGQQQMLALARALVTDAKLLMFDEPSLGLAPVLVEELYRVIERLRDEGRTILLVEQYVSRAIALAELVTVLAQGRVVFTGEPGEIPHAGDLLGSYLGPGP